MLCCFTASCSRASWGGPASDSGSAAALSQEDGLDRLLLLQQASGSFELASLSGSEQLLAEAQAALQPLLQLPQAEQPQLCSAVLATLLALALLQARFPEEREVWELQEQRGWAWLLSTALLSSQQQLSSAVALLQPLLSSAALAPLTQGLAAAQEEEVEERE